MKCLAGQIYGDGEFREGYVLVDDGRIVEKGEGKPPMVPDAEGTVIPPLVDWHTHCADAGVKPVPGMTLEELVAPPDGLKHRYLREASDDTLAEDMHGFENDAASNGIGAFVDFREGGVRGSRLARCTLSCAVILGRPESPVFDSGEVSEILDIADGISLSSISDVDPRYAEKVAHMCHSAGKTFAIHVSERVRENIETVLSLEPAFVVHMVEATDSDIARCADSGIPVVVCPRSNRFFGKIPPVKRMLAHGADVALGTDNAMLCSPDMRPEAALLADILRSQGGNPSDIWQCLINGCGKLLNRTKTIGDVFGAMGPAVVLPCPVGHDPDSALGCAGQVYVP